MSALGLNFEIRSGCPNECQCIFHVLNQTRCAQKTYAVLFPVLSRQKHFTDQFEWLIKQRSCVGQITKCCVAVTVGTISYGLACRCKSLAGTSLLLVITTNSDLYCVHVIPSTEGLHWGRKFNNQQKHHLAWYRMSLIFV